jgi:LysM repeat protein
MVALQTPDADGRIIHEVQPYQALITIADAYHVTVDRILALNGLSADWPLQVGQKLMISPGNITPSPTLSSIQRLTPETDGNYYHTVQSGETLSYIAGLYEVPLSDLMSWNGLNNTSIIYSGQKLLLLVTPPATATFTPRPTTTPFPTGSPTVQSAPTVTPPVIEIDSSGSRFNPSLFVGFLTFVLVAGGFLWWRFLRRSKDL